MLSITSHALIGWVLAALVPRPVTRAAPQPASKVQAAILYHLAKFVEWPRPLLPGAPLNVCILGADPFGAWIDEMFAAKSVNGALLDVRRVRTVDQAIAAPCRILFLGLDQVARVDYLLGRLEGRAMLTVSAIDRFAEHGGVFAFVTHQGSVRFDINVRTARREKLWISTQVLKLARRLIE